MTNSDELFNWAKDLFPMNRSLSGNGNRQTLLYIKKYLTELQILGFPSGKTVGDWTVPDEWNVTEAYISTLDGNRIIDFANNNLHLVGYSSSVDLILTKLELLDHLYTLPKQPQAIPYVTSYYQRTWGFCISQNQLDELGDGPFRVRINSTFKGEQEAGEISYGQLLIPGRSRREIVFSTYICHPSMANNELSGPVIALALALYCLSRSNYYSYRFLFLPETIGAIAYINENLLSLTDSVVAGWVLTCLGDPGEFSYIPSRLGNNYADRITVRKLNELHPSFRRYSWLNRGSDERQYCAPGVDLPFCSVTRSKYGTFPEYHTSLDNLDFITRDALHESLDFFRALVDELETCRLPKIKSLGEPQLGKRGLYPNTSTPENSKNPEYKDYREIWNLVSYLDGKHDIHDIAYLSNLSEDKVRRYLSLLNMQNLIDQ